MPEILGYLMIKKKLHAHDRELASIEKNNEPPSRSNICEYEKFVVGV